MKLNTKMLWPALLAFAVALPLMAQEAPVAQPEAAPAAKAEPVGSETCSACHADKHAAFNKTLHGKKLAARGAMDKSCESCHGNGSLHAAAAGDKTNPGFATIGNPSKMASREAAKACFSCHKEKTLMLWDTGSHAQNGLSCAKCHSVHNARADKDLKRKASETCYQCHPKQKAEMKLASHHPVPEGKMSCVSCHNPHGGVEGNLKADSAEETCSKCHAEKIGPFANEHPPVAEGCNTCHKVHGSANDRLLKVPGPVLCASCHRKAHGSSNVGVSVTQTSFQQRPRCYDCHREVHGSDKSPTFAY